MNTGATSPASTANGSRPWIWGAALVTVAAGVAAMARHAANPGGALWFLVPQLLIVLTAGAVTRSGAFALGAAAAMALYLGLYSAWAMASPPDGLVWLGYVFSLPGAALGALAGALIAWRLRLPGSLRLLGVGLLATAAGVALNQAALCATLVHCVI